MELIKKNRIRRLKEDIGRVQKRQKYIDKAKETAWKNYNNKIDTLYRKKLNNEVSIEMMRLRLKEMRDTSFRRR